MKTAIYARESSKDTTKAPDINNQIVNARKVVEDHNWQLVDLYQDNGYSGGDWKRPGINQMLKEARANRFQRLVVWNTDRLARDLMHFADIFNKLNEKHIKVFSVTEGEIDMQTAGGRIKNNIVAAVSQYEREKTGEKVRMAHAMKKARGENNWGRPSILNEMLKEKIRQMKKENPGMSYEKIAAAMPIKISYQTIRRVLKVGIQK